MASGFDIAKAGWLYRQSTVLHRWKKNWFVLDRDGDLRYFESPDNPRAEERLVVRAVVTEIRTGLQCRKAEPPEGVQASKNCFLELILRDKESMLLCAESQDDMRAWQIALEEARTMLMHNVGPGTTTTTTIITPPGFTAYGYSPYAGYGYPGHVISRGSVIHPPPAQVIHTPNGTTTVVNAQPGQQIVYVDDRPTCYRHCYPGSFYPVPLFFW